MFDSEKVANRSDVFRISHRIAVQRRACSHRQYCEQQVAPCTASSSSAKPCDGLVPALPCDPDIVGIVSPKSCLP